jgi:hypothetical protein
MFNKFMRWLGYVPAKPQTIRLWKLGNLEHKIYPTEDGIKKFAELLLSGKGEMTDIIWGPAIDVVVVDTDGQVVADHIVVHQGSGTHYIGPDWFVNNEGK